MAKDKRVIMTEGTGTQLPFADDFEQVYQVISFHKQQAASALHNESMLMVWAVGGYVSARLKNAARGDNVVRMLSEYIRTKNPKAKGWSYRTIYKMVQLYDTYSTDEFAGLVSQYGMQNYLQQTTDGMGKQIVPIEMAQIHDETFVPIELAQMPTKRLFAMPSTAACHPRWWPNTKSNFRLAVSYSAAWSSSASS